MYPYIHIILPSYAVMAFIGCFAALFFAYIQLERFHILFSTFLTMLLACIAGCFIGAKLLFALTQLPELITDFSVEALLMLLPRSGFVFYGGLFGTIFALMLFTRKNMDLRRRALRMFTPAFPLFHTFGRIGCFLAGCCYGKELSPPVSLGGLQLRQIPIQLIEAACEFVIFIVLLILDKKREQVDLLRCYLLAYAVIRFTDEFFRGDLVRGIYGGLSTSQWISLLIVLTYLIKWIKGKNEPESEQVQEVCADGGAA